MIIEATESNDYPISNALKKANYLYLASCYTQRYWLAMGSPKMKSAHWLIYNKSRGCSSIAAMLLYDAVKNEASKVAIGCFIDAPH